MRLLFALIPALLISVPTAAGAALRIAPDRLGRAAIALGQQAKVSIGISEPGLALVRARPVADAADAADALRQMLAGTGATAVQVGPRSWRIVRRPAPLYRRPPPPARRAIVAQPPPETQAGADIVVTASKRDTALADYPASVSMLLAGAGMPGLESQGTDMVSRQIPSLTSTHLGPGRNKLFVRGLADSSFNGTSQATVGEYLGEARLNYNGPDPDLRLYDLRAVEVLEGPQGTMHGVGTLGGVIRFQPTPPDLAGAGGALTLGLSATEHGDPGADLSGILNLPVTATLGLRALAYRVREGGYIDDLLRDRADVNRVDISGGRAWLRFEPDGEWTIDLSGALQEIDGRDSQYADEGGPPLTKTSPIAEGFGSRYALGSLAIRRRWNDVTLLSATSVSRQRMHESFDASTAGDPTRFDQRVRVDFFSNENRLSGGEAGGPSWLVGTSIVHNRYALDRHFAPIALRTRTGGVANGVDEATLFGEGSVDIAPDLRASIGGRFTLLELSGAAVDAATLALARDAANKADRTQTAFLPSLSLAWRPRSSLLVYGRYQQSFRPGGIVVRNAFVSRYRPDNVKSAELGFRFGGRGALLHLASSLAFTEWRNIQADQIDGDGLPTTVNIGKGRIVTLDVKANLRLAGGWSLDLAGVLADSRLTRPATATLAAFAVTNAAQSDLPNVARLNGSAALRYAAAIGDVDLSASASARYVGASRLGIGPILGRRQGDYLDAGLSMRAVRGRYALTFTVTNLLDQVGNRFALGSPFMLGQEPQLTPLRPRTARLGIEAAF
jgi:outer membrane receptor protein involved in Fe transport